MLKRILTLIMTAIGAALGYGIYRMTTYLIAENSSHDVSNESLFVQICYAIIFIFIFGLIFFRIAHGPIGRGKVSRKIQSDLQDISSNKLFAGAVGLILGLVLAYLISHIYDMIRVPYLPIILSVVTYVILGYFGVIVGSSRSESFAPMVENLEKVRQGAASRRDKKPQAIPKILDTSVIIDGRIMDIIRTGFLEGPVIIPEFVLLELQHIADSSDSLKRKKGRRGLDMLKKIQEEFGIEIYESSGQEYLDEIPEVDIKLLKLAQHINGKVVTNDFNLNKVAGLQDVEVLNINELANAVKPVVMPDEDMEVFLLKQGRGQNQAVAYLEDGTMIVVENGQRFIGKTIRVTVTNILQTAAGRMIFARPARRH